MAYAIATVNTNVIAAAEPAAGAVIASSEVDSSNQLIRLGFYIHTTIAAAGFATMPSGHILIRVFGCATTGATAKQDGNIVCRFLHRVGVQATNTTGPYAWTDFCPLPLPRYSLFEVLNATDVAIATNALNVYVDYVKETS